VVLRAAFFILMALGLVGFGAVAWISTRPPQTETVAIAPAAPVKTLVTTRAMVVGAMMKPEDITVKDMPANGDLTGAINADVPDVARTLAGSMVKRPLAAGQVIRSDDVLTPGDHGFMAAVLQPGMRAVTIGVDATSGSAGLVWPGDRVDLILTQTLTDPMLPPGRRVAAETVLTNARVIAIDQRFMQGVAPTGNEGQARTVTLEVNPEEVQRVSVAMRLGRLSLSVRAVSQNNADGTTSPVTSGPRSGTAGPPTPSIFARDVSAALGDEVPVTLNRTVRVYQGVAEPKEFKY
jgi:pilus assembly protein CpaB